MSSREERRQQKTPKGACPREEAVKLQGTAGGPSSSPARSGESPRGGNDSGLMEQVVARENMLAALRRVERNGGAPGIDGIPTERLRDQIRAEWPRIREELLTGTYKPKPVRRVEIPKPGGGKRLLGIPTVMDRLIQRALLQVLTPVFDPQFSEASFGFRPGRRAHDAVRKARQYVEEGYEWAVDLDIDCKYNRTHRTPQHLSWGLDGILCPGRNTQRIQGPGWLDAEEATHVSLEAVEAGTYEVSRASGTGVTGASSA